MLTNKNEAKLMAKHISCECKFKFSSRTCNSNQKWNKKTCQCECRNDRKCKKDYNQNPSTCICKNSKYSKSIPDTSVTDYDEIITVMDIVSTKLTNAIATNFTSTASTYCHSEEVRDCYVLNKVLLVIILILMIVIVCYFYVLFC